MLLRLIWRFLRATDIRLAFKFCYNFGWKGMRAVEKFKRRSSKTENPFPAFIVASVTNKCNLRCQGCWISVDEAPVELSTEQLGDIISKCREKGSFFFGILGGEPLLYPNLLKVFKEHPDCYFQLFTNGTLMTDEIAAGFRVLGNVTPLVSVEGRRRVSDERRGGKDVYEKSLRGIEACVKNRLITGVATSVCRSNIDDLVSMDFLKEVMDMGVLYLWYYIYRPVGPAPCPELALGEEDILRLREFIVEARTRVPLIIVDAYWDADGNAVCPASMGLSHHIGPAGDVEFCPPLQFSRDKVSERPLDQILENPSFISRFRKFAASETRGCVILEKPAELLDFLNSEKAVDSSLRNSAFNEISRMCPRCGHHTPGKAIPEKHWAYRLAKKYWFFGFGAYG